MTAPVLEDRIEVKLCLGLIDLLVQEDLLTWQADAKYPVGHLMPAGFLVSWPTGPDRVAAFTPYAVTDDPGMDVSTVGVQVRTRWAGSNPRAVINYAGAIFDVLHGLGPTMLAGGVSISLSERRTSVSMGQDSSQRWSWADNYYVSLSNPSSNRS